MKKRDFVFLFCIIAVCLTLFLVKGFLSQNGDSVLIYVDKKLYKTVSLYDECEIDTGTNIIAVDDGCVYMKSADCPDKICVHTGEIKDNSKDIVCLPNKVIVKVTKKSAIDAVSG